MHVLSRWLGLHSVQTPNTGSGFLLIAVDCPVLVGDNVSDHIKKANLLHIGILTDMSHAALCCVQCRTSTLSIMQSKSPLCVRY